MRGILLSSLLLLTACASTPGIKVQTVEVPVVKVEKCIKKEDIPQKPSGLGGMPSSVDDQRRILLAKVLDWVQYGHQTDILFKDCTTP